VAIKVGVDLVLQQREHVPDQCPAARHPLEIRPASMVIGAIQPAIRETFDQPVEQGLVARVHPQRHLGLLSVAAKRALADEETDHHAAVEVGQRPNRGG